MSHSALNHLTYMYHSKQSTCTSEMDTRAQASENENGNSEQQKQVDENDELLIEVQE